MTNKTALITGVSRGLGRAMAKHLTTSGTRVIGTYRSGRDEAEELAEELTRNGHEIAVLPLDVRDTEAYPAFVDQVRQTLRTRFGASGLDHLVNNAGIGTFATFPEA